MNGATYFLLESKELATATVGDFLTTGTIVVGGLIVLGVLLWKALDVGI